MNKTYDTFIFIGLVALGLLIFFGRELRDHPLTLLREYWRQFSPREANLMLKKERLRWIHEQYWLRVRSS